MTRHAANKQKKGSTLVTRRPKSAMAKRRNKAKARARRALRRISG